MAEQVLGGDVTLDGKSDLDISNAGDFGSIGGVTFTDAANVGSGTGGYNTFLAIQDNNDAGAWEAGFNSDDSGSLDPTNPEMDAAKSHTLKLGDLVVTTINNVQYVEFRVDLNEANSDPNAQISIDQFRLYSSSSSTIESTTVLNTQHVVYDMDTAAGQDVSVLLSDAGSTGSGTDDYSVLVPLSYFKDANGNPLDPALTYIYLYVEMGHAGADWGATSTFEEWNLENGVTLTGVKFNDINGNGVRDTGENGVSGVTIFIDANNNGTLDTGERSTVTGVGGSYSFFGVKLGQTYIIDEVVPAGQQQSTGDNETITIASNAKPGTTFVVDPIGNFTPNPALNVTKVVSSITGGVGGKANSDGDVINYTINVQNTGNIGLHNITVTDPNATTLTAVLSGGFNSGDIDHDNVLDVGETWHYTATHTVTQDELDGKGIDNTGAIDGDGDDDNTVTADSNETGEDTADASAPLDYNAALNVTKAVTSIDGGQGTDGLLGADDEGDVINYEIHVQNTGNITLHNVTVTDPNADTNSITYVSGDTDHDGDLDVGETWVYTATHTVSQDELDGQGIDNAGVVDGDGDVDNTVTADSDETGEDTADASAPLIYAPAFNIVKDVSSVTNGSVDGKVDGADNIINYAISVDNTGNVSLTGVNVTDPYADLGSITYVSGDTDNDGELDVTETWHYTATHHVTQAEIDSNGDGNGELENTATAHSNETPDDSDDAEVPIALAPNINLIKEVDSVTNGTVDGKADDAGDVINYHLTVQNTGNVSLTNVVVDDNNADPGTVEAVTVDFMGTDYNVGDVNHNNILETTEEWEYTAQHTVTQDELDTRGGGDNDIDNIASATSDEAGPDYDDAEVPLVYAPGLNVTKTVTSIDGGAGVDGLDGADTDGDVINYTITVENTGNITLTGITVTDPNATTGPTYASGDTNTNGKLDVGETWTYTATHTVTQAELDHQGIDNTGAFDGDGDDDNTVTADSDQTGEDTADASAPLVYNPSVTIDKTASVNGDCADEVDELINYQISVHNDGNITLEHVVVTDDFADAGSVVGVDLDSNGKNDGDTDGDGKLDVGETWLYTAYHTVTQADIDSNGNYDSDNDGSVDVLRNVATVNADVVDSDDTVTDSDDASVPVCQNPAIVIEKDASIDDGCADTVNELINYTLNVANTGNVSLTSVLISDTVADAGSITGVDADSNGFNDGDTDENGVLGPGETWYYTAFHTVTQADLDTGGNYDSSDPADGINDSIRNVATVDATVVGSNYHVTDDDDAVADVCQYKTVDLEKYVSVAPTSTPPGAADSSWDDADGAPGPQDINVGADVWFKVTIHNTGNVTLTNVDVSDTNNSNGTTGSPNLLIDDGELTQFALDHGATSIDGDDGNHLLDVGETWTVIYSQGFDAGSHVNTAEVATDEGATDADDAHYFSLVDLGPCPRTPGFWQNPKNGGAFWDGVVGDPVEAKHAGEHDFPDGDLLYPVYLTDTNGDGHVTNADAPSKGLLIGDWDGDGITNNGEDTLFIDYDTARKLINASNKQLNGLSGDGKFMLGRDMVAAWLNYEMGAGFGTLADPNSPASYLQDAINFMQIYGGATAGGLGETQDTFVLSGAIKASSPQWKQVQPGVDHSGSQLHSALDYYNNTGHTSPNSILYANCGEDFDQALAIYEAAHTSGTATMASLTSTKTVSATTMSTTTMSSSTLTPLQIASSDFGNSFELGSMQHLHSYDLI